MARTRNKTLLARSSLALALAGVTGTAGGDDSLMCGNSLVKVGMAATEIVAKCGMPTDKAIEDRPIRLRNPVRGTSAIVGSVRIERWTYDRGARRFPAVLTFEAGKLESIELVTRP